MGPSSPYSDKGGGRKSILSPSSAAAATLPQQTPQQQTQTVATAGAPSSDQPPGPVAPAGAGAATDSTGGNPESVLANTDLSNGSGPAAAAPTAAPDAKEVTGGFKTTHFGYPDDENGDAQTKAGNGAFGKFASHNVPKNGYGIALTDSMAEKLGVPKTAAEGGGGEEFDLKTTDGRTLPGIRVDRAPQSNEDRVDIYDPNGSKKAGEPFQIASIRRKGVVRTAANAIYPNNS